MKRTYDDRYSRSDTRDSRDTYYRDPAAAGAASSSSTATSPRRADSRHHHGSSRREDRSRDRRDRHRDGNGDRDRRRHGSEAVEEGEIVPTSTSTSSTRRQPPPTSSAPARPTSSASRATAPSASIARSAAGKQPAAPVSQESLEPDYDALYTASATASKPKTAAELLEEKKRKRAAILAKHQQRLSVTPGPEASPPPPTPVPSSASVTQALPNSIPGTPAGLPAAVRALRVEGTATPDVPMASGSTSTLASPRLSRDASPYLEAGDAAGRAADERDVFDLRQSGSLGKGEGEGDAAMQPDKVDNSDGREELSAADYNPDEDLMQDDRRERERLHLDSSRTEVSKGGQQRSNRPVQQIISSLQVEDEDDNDDEDDDDMFAVKKKKPRLALSATAGQAGSDSAGVDADTSKVAFVPVIDRSAGDSALDSSGTLIVDNYDDPEGYYRVILGELLGENGRYHVHANLGKGMFSNVVKAKDTLDPSGREVAIKLIRSQESMYRAGQKEAGILRKILEADPQDKRHLIRLERTFEHKGHLCLVFESLYMNLRDVIKKFGKDVGINLKAVRAYSIQIFQAMNLLRKLNIMHADFKPDNILVNEAKNMLKVCDLGSASDTSEADITPYLVSRFYRAPEIILGLPYDCSIDMWSIACTLYELYTGKILFPGRSNNHMLLLIQELKGRYPGRLVKKAKFGDVHFEESSFVHIEKDRKTGSEMVKRIVIPPQSKNDLRARLMGPAIVKKLTEEEGKLLGNFVDMLSRSLELDPAKRLTPKEALNHPFLR